MSNPVTRFFASRGFAKGLGSLGRFMITSGTVILLLVAYQLWGTNLQTNKHQSQLGKQFASITDPGTIDSAPATTTPGGTTTTRPGDDPTPETTPPKVASTTPAPGEGQPIGNISIPSIGLHDFWIVEGTQVPDLKLGAGHYVGNPLPGQQGNAAIAGHRTTYGAPFHNIDKVKVGDPIVIVTVQGTFRYEVTGQKIVSPHDGSVLDPTPTPTLTLTACHPKFSAAQRIITFAKLVGNPVPKLADQDAAAKRIIDKNKGSEQAADSDAIDEFSTEPAVTFPGAWWGVACMGLWIVVRLLAWQFHKRGRPPRWLPYALGTPICLVLLYFFFEAFSYEGFTRVLGLKL